MRTVEKPREILKVILKQYGVEDKILFQLKHKFMLHLDLRKEKYYDKKVLNNFNGIFTS